MKRIMLKFATEYGRFAFYDRAWCCVHDCPQCDECARNPKRYKNWDPPGAYTGFLFSDEDLEKAKAGDCYMFEEAKDINALTNKEVE